MRFRYDFLGLMVFSVVFTACSSSQYIGSFSSVDTEKEKQINDDDIRKAFEANPQITLPASMAIYNASRDKYPFQDSVLTVKNISRAVEISPALLNPDGYYYSQQHEIYAHSSTIPEPINLMKLRLYAAQSKSDLVMFVSSSTGYDERSNLLSILYAGLVTIPIIPGRNAELTTYLEAYIFDVRNGLLYSSYRDKRTFKKRFVKVGFAANIDEIKQQQIDEMMPDFLSYVRSTITHPDLQLTQE